MNKVVRYYIISFFNSISFLIYENISDGLPSEILIFLKKHFLENIFDGLPSEILIFLKKFLGKYFPRTSVEKIIGA